LAQAVLRRPSVEGKSIPGGVVDAGRDEHRQGSSPGPGIGL
jgi:hypothetical protein